MRTVFLFLFSGSFLCSLAQIDNGISFCGASFQNIDFTQPLFTIDSVKDSNNAKIAVPYVKLGAINPDLADVEYQRKFISSPPPKYDEYCHANSTSCHADAANLKYYVYYPSNFDYAHCKAPVIILFHGGGFIDCGGSFDADDLQYMCREFAKRGYVVFDVEYRRGRYIDPTQTYFTAQQSLALYRAMQDARGAIRSIIRMESRHSIDFPTLPYPYSIDVNKIFVGGASAGSVMAIQTVYYPDDAQVASIFPNAGTNTIKDVLGSINADYYYGDSTLNIWSNIKGCINLWGQAYISQSYKDNEAAFFANYNVQMKPMISFHGNKDETLRPYRTSIIFPTNMSTQYVSFHLELNCLKNGLSYAVPSNNNPIKLQGIGSQRLYEVFNQLYDPVNQPRAKMELYVDCDMGHGINNFTTDNFGITATSDNDVYQYIVQRTTTFLQAVLLTRETKIGTDRFVGCVNKRVKAVINTGCNCLPDNIDPTTTCQDCPAQ